MEGAIAHLLKECRRNRFQIWNEFWSILRQPELYPLEMPECSILMKRGHTAANVEVEMVESVEYGVGFRVDLLIHESETEISVYWRVEALVAGTVCCRWAAHTCLHLVEDTVGNANGLCGIDEEGFVDFVAYFGWEGEEWEGAALLDDLLSGRDCPW